MPNREMVTDEEKKEIIKLMRGMNRNMYLPNMMNLKKLMIYYKKITRHNICLSCGREVSKMIGYFEKEVNRWQIDQ